MLGRLWVLSLFAFAASGAEVAGPSRFFIVSQFFSDHGALFYYRVLDVVPEGDGSRVRYIRVAPASVDCTRKIVQAAAGTVKHKRPAEIAMDANPCAIRPSELASTIRKYPRRDGVFECVSFGIVAQCGSSTLTLALPISQQVDLPKIRAARPDIARLWDLVDLVAEPVFGKKDIFHDRTEEEDLALQTAGQELLPELTSRKFDRGLAAAARGFAGSSRTPRFGSMLAGYRGPFSASEMKAAVTPRLLNAQAYQFGRYVASVYPPLARQARIEGSVELELEVQRETGEVVNVQALSGHPLLKPAAVVAARSWRFAANSVDTSTVRLTLEYAIRCP